MNAYGLDLVGERSLLGAEEPSALGLLQSLVVQPLWLALVWVFRAALTIIEWAFSLDLIRSRSAFGGLLGQTARFGSVLLPAALAVGAANLAYQGLVRRQVAAALGAAAATAAFIVLGLGIGNDASITGQAAQLTDTVAQEVLASGSAGTGSSSALLSGLGEAAVERPWCFLEFGDVGWCQRHSSPALSAAAAKASPGFAQTPEAAFLRHPAESYVRSDIESQDSLVRAMCGSEELSTCHGPDGARAQFMTTAGTWGRVGGLVLILVGDAGILLLLGAIGIRMVVAAAAAVLLIALAPLAAVVATFGAAGRETFRRWLTYLCGAIATKVIAALVLGLVLAALGMVRRSLPGFWIPWLTGSALAWGVFLGRRALVRSPRLPSLAQRVELAGAVRAGAGILAAGRLRQELRPAGGAGETESFRPPRIPPPARWPEEPATPNAPLRPASGSDEMPGETVESTRAALRRAQREHEARTGRPWGPADRAHELVRLAGQDYWNYEQE